MSECHTNGQLLRTPTAREAEKQIVTHFEVYAERPAVVPESDSILLLLSLQVYQPRFPRMVTADAGFYSRERESGASAGRAIENHK
jgi:hypothetical protein